ncbi:protein of unknown function [Duganella sp. CF402]|uniref:3-keto-disaccharide hydrolase n=1 Tax=unclassified Duganella TaxID=2636909 RepID=UPI0008BBA0EF|nr:MULTISPECIES: DUF1080 domain-containing protein [unclassified Duganella]RZT10485.1 uncharacterized protein DUF1080 [Duganella sp. BK701]SEL11125.1 protein of unknown function [Duganella sp. CF402]
MNKLLGAIILTLSAHSAGAAELFNGRDFSGWELQTTPAAAVAEAFQVLPDGVIASAGKPSGFIATRESYRNYKLHVEWRWPGKPGNGGVLLHISPGTFDRVWPVSLQVQTKFGNAGDLLPMAAASFAEPLTSAPGAETRIKAHTAADSEKPAGEWNTCDIVSRDGTVEVTVNGVLQNRVSNASPASGRIGFQLEGTPYELRRVELTPLD